ncbi:MAG TPA: SDR family NAD(P)-dependent oxidoreductase [Baekduia sp.]|nr:SDR family NAD(P)-dependent oxidoreductase [Baekduia sp.]
MPDWLGLSGRRVAVAGGYGTIGRALVDGFADAGARVAVIDLDGSPPDQPGAADVLFRPADLTDPDACRTVVEDVAEALGGIDVFVHSAGINDRRPIEDYAPDDWRKIIDVNASSAFWTMQAVLPRMRAQGYGRIVLFSSVAGRSGHKHHAPYAASKGAINQVVRVAANEYAAHGVTINAVAPGYMDTTLTRAYLEDHPEVRARLVDLIPAQRFGRLEEVVGPVLFLASDQASFVNGQILYIDGGRTVV